MERIKLKECLCKHACSDREMLFRQARTPLTIEIEKVETQVKREFLLRLVKVPSE